MSKLVARATGAAAVAMNVAPDARWQLEEFRIHLSAVGTAGDLTITVDDADGAVYDIVIYRLPMAAITDHPWKPANPIPFDTSDEINIAWANASNRTYGIEVIYSLIA